MNTKSLDDAIDRALTRIKEGVPEMADNEYTSDVTRYTDVSRFNREQQAIFQSLPNYVAHVSELPEPGSFVRRELAGVSVLLVRGDDGHIRAFVNACRHRGTQLVSDQEGCSKRFVCPYHAWSYNRDGSLAAVPSEFGFPNLNREEDGLVELPLWQRNGLLWTLLNKNKTFDFDAFWQPIASEIDSLKLEDSIVYKPSTRDWNANWKLVVEGGLESYHFRKTHAKTIAPYFVGNNSIYDAFGLHSRLLLPRKNFTELENKSLGERSIAGYAHIVYTLLPNMSLLVQEDHVALIVFTPKAVDQTSISIAMLVEKSVFDEKADSHWETNSKITNVTLNEDFEIGEAIQRGIAGDHLGHLTFGRFEHGLASINRSIDLVMESNQD